MESNRSKNENPRSRSISPSRSYSSPRGRSGYSRSFINRRNTRSKSLSRSLTRRSNSSTSRLTYSRSYSSDRHRRRRSRSHSTYSSSSSRSYSSDRYRRRSNRNRSTYSSSRSRSYSSDRYCSCSQNRSHNKATKCLAIFGLDCDTRESQLHRIFEKYGSIDEIDLIMDTKSGKFRGFGFVYFKHREDAKKAKEESLGMKIGGRRIRIYFSMSRRSCHPSLGSINVGYPAIRKHSYDRYNRRERYDKYYTDDEIHERYRIQRWRDAESKRTSTRSRSRSRYNKKSKSRSVSSRSRSRSRFRYNKKTKLRSVSRCFNRYE